MGVAPGTATYMEAADHARTLAGEPVSEIFARLFPSPSQAQAAHLSFDRSYLAALNRHGLLPAPGAEQVLEKLAGAGMAVCFLSPHRRPVLTQLLDTLGWWQRTFLAMSPEDTERPVPYPDPFLTAVLRASLTSVQDLMVCASTPAVIQAAARSGAGTIAALPGPHPPEALQAAGATHLLDSIAAFPALVLNQPAITGTLFGNKGP